jgi:hypothetical protein
MPDRHFVTIIFLEMYFKVLLNQHGKLDFLEHLKGNARSIASVTAEMS